MLVISKDLESKVETVVLWQQRFDLDSNGLILSWSNDLLRGCVILPKSFQNQQIGWWFDGWPPIQKTDSSAIRWPFCWGTPRCGASVKIGSSRSTGQRYGQLRYWWSALNLSCSENFHKPTGFWCRQSARWSFLRCWWTKSCTTWDTLTAPSQKITIIQSYPIHWCRILPINSITPK